MHMIGTIATTAIASRMVTLGRVEVSNPARLEALLARYWMLLFISFSSCCRL